MADALTTQSTLTELALQTTLLSLQQPLPEVLSVALPRLARLVNAYAAGLYEQELRRPLRPLALYPPQIALELPPLSPDLLERLRHNDLVLPDAQGGELWVFGLGKTVGAVLVLAFRERPDPALRALLEVYTEALAAVYEGARRQERLTRFRGALLELLSTSLPPDPYGVLLEKVLPIIPHAEGGSIFLRGEGGDYRIVATSGYDVELLREVRLSPADFDVSADLETFRPRLTPYLDRLRSQHPTADPENVRRMKASRQDELKVTLSVPVRVGEQVQAVLFFDNFSTPEAFDTEAVEIAELFGAQIGVVFERLEGRALALRQERFRQRLLETISDALSEGLHESFYSRLLGRALEVIPGAQAGSVIVKEGDAFGYVAAEGFSLATLQRTRFAADEIDTWCRSHPSVVLYHHQEALPHTPQRREILERGGRLAEIRATLSLPVRLEGEVVAMVNLDNFSRRDAFTAEAVAFAEVFVQQVAVVLQRLRLQGQAERRATFQRLLARIESLLLESERLERFLPLLAELLIAEPEVGTQQVSIYRLQPDGHLSARFYGLQPDEGARVAAEQRALGMLEVATGRGLIVHAARSQQPYYAPDVGKDPHWVQVAGHVAPIASIVLLPVSLHGRLWGIFDLVAGRLDAFDQTLREFLTQVARSIELALVKEHDRKNLLRRVAQMSTLVSTNEALRLASSLEHIYRSTLESALRESAADAVCILRLEPNCEGLRLVAGVSRRGHYTPGLRIPKGTGAAWRVLEGGRILRLGSLGAEDAYLTADAPLNTCGCPLSDEQGQAIGVLLASSAGEAFSDSDLSYLEALAYTCAGAVVRLDLLARAERKADAYRALAEFGETIEEINDIPQLMELGLKSLLEQLGFDAAASYELREEGLYAAQAWGAVPPELLQLWQTPIRIGEGLAGRVITGGHMMYLDDYRTWPHALPDYRALGLGTQLAIPVRQGGSIVKVILLSCFRRVTHLSHEGFTVARNFVKRLENALERADNLREVEATREATLRSLGLMLEYRDVETKGHTDRVVALSLRLARRLDFSPVQLRTLRWGAYLHDIGKVAVPDRILRKPAALEPEEYERVKMHPIIGARMCQEIPFLPPETREVIRNHHERWDGAGYPDGLSGDGIPLLARMFSLIDVYDALTNPRPYKLAWSAERALEEIHAQAGRQFDPDLAQRFTDMLRRGDGARN